MIKLFLLLLTVYSAPVEALTCVKDYGSTESCLENPNPAGDCSTLGYSTTDVDGCEHYLYCPFNTTYKKCVAGGNELNCAELGFTSEDKSAWYSNIITCPNDNTLTACVGQCVYSDICVDKTDEATASMPSAYAELKYENCTACGQTNIIVTGWDCESGYGRAEYNTISCLICGRSYIKDKDRDALSECLYECEDYYGYECGLTGSNRICNELEDCRTQCRDEYSSLVQC